MNPPDKSWPSFPGKPEPTQKQINRFWSKVTATPDCWKWSGRPSGEGYNDFTWRVSNVETSVRAHRITYLTLVGEIPDGHVIDHLCRNRACVNPWHLEPVVRRENALRGAMCFNLTGFCRAGLHDMTYEPNIYVSPRGKRECYPCKTETSRKYKERKRNERNG